MSRKADRRQRRIPQSRSFLLEVLEDRCVPTGSVSGLVFQDYNANGVQDSSEPGVSGIIVNAYDASNNLLVTGTTSSVAATLGQYDLAIPGTTTAVRVEFVIPAALSYLQPGAVAPTGATGVLAGPSVQFVGNTTTNPTNIDFGVNNPSDYTQSASNLALATVKYVTGNQLLNADNSPNTAPVLFSFPEDARGASPTETPLADANQVGAISGITYQNTSNTLFASAMQRSLSGFGPAGTGGIYSVNLTGATPAVSTLLNVDSLVATLGGAFNTGADPHPQSTPGTYDPNAANPQSSPWFTDTNSFDAVGKISLGGLTLSDDGTWLYTINLNTRELLEIPVTTSGQLDATRQALAVPIPLTLADDALNFDNPQDIRPWAVTFHDGLLYVGMVYSAQTTQDASTLRSYVYSFNPTTQSFSAAPVLSINLSPANDPRGSADITGSAPSAADPSADWNPWVSSFPIASVAAQVDPNLPAYPEPMLTSIAFDNGDMIVGMGDRFGAQGGYFAGDPNDPTSNAEYTTLSAGDVLRAGLNANGTSWTVEADGVVTSATNGTITSGSTATAAGANVGIGGHSFYYNKGVARDTSIGATPNTFGHQEIALGSVLQIAGSPQVISTSYDPLAGFTAGVYWFNNQTNGANPAGFDDPGDVTITQRPIPVGTTPTYVIGATGTPDRLQLFDTPAGTNTLATPPVISKANGLGGLTALAAPAPVEIGDRVWLDSNGNGIQDVGEPGIAGVTVDLYSPHGTLLATAITDANGDYLFSNNAGTTTASAIYNLATLTANTSGYTIRIDNAANYGASGPLAGLTATQLAAGSNRSIDSNGSPFSATDTRAAVNVGPFGDNDHTIDFGFTPVATPLLSLGDLVWVDLNNDGVRQPGEPGVPNLTMKLLDTNGNLLATTTTNANGNYLFTGLAAGTYVVEFDKPAGFVSSTGTGPNGSITSGPFEPPPTPFDNINNEDKGTTVGAEIVSIPVTLTTTGNPDTNGTANLRVDFGIFQPTSPIPNSLSGDICVDDNPAPPFMMTGPLGGVTVELEDVNGNVLATTTSGADGSYAFNNLPNGTYSLVVEQPAGYLTGPESVGSAGGSAGVHSLNGINLTGDVNGTQYDFCFQVPPAKTALTLLSKVQLLASNLGADPSQTALVNYVNGLYNVILNRAPDQAGLNNWVAQLLGGTSRQTVARAIWESTESRTLQINQYYEQYLGRAADPAGIQGFLAAYRNGASDVDVQVSLLTSTEFLAKHPDAASFLDGVYATVLGRSVDPASRSFWLPQLTNPANWANVARAVLNSDEANQRVVNQDYISYLGRSADSTGLAYWIPALRLGTISIDQVSWMLLASDEFFNRTQS